MLHAPAAKQVSQLFLLRLQIFLGKFSGRDLAGHSFGYLDTGALERGDFVGIIREQADPLDVQSLQDLNRHKKLALVGLETKAFVGFDGVKSAVLKRVGLQFRHQSYTAALLVLIDKDARSQVGDHGERHFELLAAIAAQRAEYVAGQTLRMNAHQRRPGVYLAHHERDCLFGLGAVARCRRPGGKPVNQEMPPARRKVRRRYLFYL